MEQGKTTTTQKTKRPTQNYDTNSATIRQQGKKLAYDLHNQIEGASINSNTIKLLKQIKPTNVLHVLDEYSKLTKGKETLAQAVDNEWGLDIITVKEYICPQLVALAKNKGVTGVYYGDFMKLNDMQSLNKWIENAKTRLKIALNINLAETTVVKVKTGTIVINGPTEKLSPEQIYKNRQNKSVGQALYNQIQGASNGQNTLKLITQRVNAQNIVTVMDEYKRLSNGKESLPQALSEEYSLDVTTKYSREAYIRYFHSRLTEYAQKHKLNIPKALTVTQQNADDLDKLVELTDKLHNYVKSKIQEPIKMQTSLKGYINELGLGDPQVAKRFEGETGISFNQALLTDPTINKNDKINAIRNSFTYYSRITKHYDISIKDIIDDANNDLQTLAADGDFKKYAPLYETTLKRLQARINRLKDEPTTNGKIDKDFSQGQVGDCWLLASIKALSMNEKGLKTLNDSIKLHQNGNITVHLKGVDKTYEISKKELENALELSKGDGDVRAIEIAVNRYLREMYKQGDSEQASLDGNHMHVAYQILTGKGEHFFPVGSNGDRIFNSEYYDDVPITDEDIKAFNEKDTITCVSAHGNQQNIEIYNKSDNSSGILTTNHAYTVVRSDDKNVYLINPWDTSKEIPVDIKTFKTFFTSIDKFKL